MTILPESIRADVERSHGQHPLLWLLELELDPGDDVIPAVIVRLVNYHDEVQWPKDDPAGTTWYPFPFSHSGFAANTQGDLQFVDVSIDNTGLLLMRWLHATGGLEGAPAKIYLVSANSLDLVYPNHEALPKEGIDLTVVSASANSRAVTLRLGDPNFLSVMTPHERYNPRTCRHQFAKGRCPYVLNQFAAFDFCPKHVEACNERGADMRARGLPDLLPRMFGAFPGLARRRR